jgi:hypothetical protein
MKRLNVRKKLDVIRHERNSSQIPRDPRARNPDAVLRQIGGSGPFHFAPPDFSGGPDDCLDYILIGIGVAIFTFLRNLL